MKDNGGLEHLCKTYISDDVVQQLTFHNSVEDAKATMILLQYLLKKFSLTLEELVNKVGPECVISSKYDIELSKLNSDKKKLREFIFKPKEFVFKSFNMLRKERKKDDKNIKALTEEKYQGKRFGFSNGIEKSSFDCVKLCEMIEKSGYLLAFDRRDMNILICMDEKDCSVLNGKFKHEIKLITIDEFLI